MALWVIAALLVPLSLNQLDKFLGSMIVLARAIKRKRRGW